MIFILTVSFIWGAFLSLFVLAPLFSSQKKDLLASAPPYSKAPPHAKNESGKSSLKFIFILTAVLFFVFAFIQCANAQTKPQAVPRQVKVPPPYVLSNTGYWLPSVNQFILIPQQGNLHVYYVGMFSNSLGAQRAKILLPFPRNTMDVNISAEKTAIVDKTNQSFILETPLSEDVNQIQAEFNLQAAAGSAVWKKNSLDVLPGVTIIMLEKGAGHFLNFPKDFRSMKNAMQFVRVGDFLSNFPEFEIIDIVPSRFYIYLLILFFSCFLIAVLFVYFLTLKNRSVDLASKQ